MPYACLRLDAVRFWVQILSVSLLWSANAFGYSYSGGVYTTNGSLSDVQGACTDAATNHPTATVSVPSGTFTWGTGNATLSITSAITLLGNGGIVNSAGVIGASGTPTVIDISANMTSEYGAGLINISGGAVVVAGFQFVALSSSCGEPISINGSNGPDGFRINNVTYDPTDGGTVQSGAYFIETEQCYGLIDHCAVTNSGGSGNVEFIYGRGHTDAWQNPPNYGSSGLVGGVPQAVYIENCSFSGGGKSAVEFDSNGRFVVRFCTLDGMDIDGHGFTTNGAPVRGFRMMEFYDNTWTATSGYYDAWLVRGGTFMGFNNISEMASGDCWMEWLDMGTQDPQSFISTTNPSNYQIAISTITASAGVFTVTTAVPHGLTVGKTIPDIALSCATCNPALSTNSSGTPLYTVVTTGPSTFTISGVSAVSGGTGGSMCYTRTPVNYHLQDQVGVGPDVGGIPFSGAAGGNPGYSWSNTLGGSAWPRTLGNQDPTALAIYSAETGNASFTDNDIVQEDRDVFTDLTVSGSFNGTTGVGTGTYAAMEAITPTKTGVGFWVTNQGSWNSTVAANTSGQLYTWNGSSWVLTYTPYQYPYIASSGQAIPAITSASSASGKIGSAFSYSITATNSPASFGATGLPSGLSVNSSTGVISGTPLAAGSFSVTLSATNSSGTGSATLALTVSPATPAITSASSASGKIGSAFSYSITATNSPASFGATGLPSGLSVNSSTGVISGTPLAAGSFSVTLSATNSSGTGSATLALTVSPATPAITSASSASGKIGSAFSYSITATNSPASFGATGLPTGLSVNSSTGVISGTPSAAGSFNVTLSATNSSSTGSATLALTVGQATPAITSASSASVKVGSAFSYSITATNSPASFAATGLPSGLSVNSSTGVISGTPLAAGSFSVTLSATNSSSTGSATLALTVGQATPAITSASSASVKVGSAFSYSITATNSPASFAATGLPSGLSVNSSTGVISGTPLAAGSFSVTLSATNSSGTGSATLALTVSPATPAITSASSASGKVGSAFSYSITATNSPASFAATGLPSGLSVNSSTGVISGTPLAAGSFSVTLSATNSSGTGSATLALTVSPATPAITSASSASVKVGSAFSYSITATNSPASFGATGLPTGLSVNSSTGVISGTPSAAGSFNVTLSATNSSGTGSATLALTVGQATPAITSASSASVKVGSAFSYSITATNSPASFGATGLPSGLSVNASTGVISGTASPAGSFNVTLSATNSSGTGSATLVLSITNGNYKGVYFGNGADKKVSSADIVTSSAASQNWALSVQTDNSAVFIGYLGGSAIVQNLTINADGTFSLPSGTGPSSQATAISGAISGGSVTGAVGSTTIGGAVDTGGSWSFASGFYSGSALFGTSGNVYVVVGGDGQVFVVETSGSSTDAASGNLDSSGNLTATGVNGGQISLTVNSSGQLELNAAASGSSVSTTFAGLASQVSSTARIMNLSVMTNSGSGSDVLAFGFAINGDAKQVLLRAIGPGLTSLGVPGTIPDPQLALYQGESLLQSNSGWGGSAALQSVFADLGAFLLDPTSKDSALLTTLQPGAYTAEVSSLGGSSGMALAELYDADAGSSPPGRLVNISARANVGATGLVAGVVIGGNAPERILIRGVGPGLAPYGVSGILPDPQIDLYQNSTPILHNQGWGGDSALTAAFAQVGAFPLADADAAVIVTLPPGVYSARVSGVSGDSGVALVEVYELP